ncbi:MAG: Ig-like domain-containing protein [Pseudonocardiaceae bacterium]
MATSLLIGGVANSVPPGTTTPQATDSTAATATSTALTTSPASPVAQGTEVTLTATITPATAAGTVQFKDGTTNLGDPVAVSNGTASGSTSALAAGSRSLTAVFTPSNPTTFGPSTSPMVTFVVTGANGNNNTNNNAATTNNNAAATNNNNAAATTNNNAAATSTTMTTSPASQVAQGTPVTLTAAIAPATAAGTVQFKDGATNLGDPVAVSNGTASASTSTLAVGSHSLTAVFTPSDPAAANPSTSPAVPLTVTGSGVGSQVIVSQQSGLSLDVRVSVLDGRDGRVVVLDGGPSILDTSMPVLNGQGPVLDARLSVLVGEGMLSGIVRPARTEVTSSER